MGIVIVMVLQYRLVNFICCNFHSLMVVVVGGGVREESFHVLRDRQAGSQGGRHQREGE